MRITHLAPDEKFIDQAIRQFEEVLPGQNTCIVISSRRQLRHVKTSVAHRVSPLLGAWGGVSGILASSDLVVLHSLSRPLWRTCRGLPVQVPLLWLGFGYDYYDLIHDDVRAYTGPISAVHAQASRRGLRGWWRVRKADRWHREKLAALQRITHFAPVLPTEKPLLLERRPDFHPTFVPWSYSSIEDTLRDQATDVALDAQDILVGNSSSTTNNHLETLALLSRILPAGPRRIIMPLSYGNRRYRAIVLTAGRSSFGNRFVPLTDFLPAAEYIRLLTHCRTAVMNHVRQQAVGNIMILLYQGATVFLNERSPVYRYLSDAGAVVHTVGELERDAALLDLRMTPAQVRTNRAVLAALWGREMVQERTRTLLSTILGTHPHV